MGVEGELRFDLGRLSGNMRSAFSARQQAGSPVFANPRVRFRKDGCKVPGVV